MRVLFFTDYFPPETNAAASRVYERARYWLAWGHEVTVVTSAPNFPRGEIHAGYRNLPYQKEVIEGIEVVRVWTYMAPNRGKWRRGLDFLSYLLCGFPVGLVQSKPDVIVATSPNFFSGLCGCLVAILRRRPFVLEVGDLWPAFVVELGEMKHSVVVELLERIERFMYRRASRVVCLTHAFRENLAARGVPLRKLAVVRNGVELDLFQPTPPDMGLSAQINPEGKFLVGYYGTMGAAHGLESAIEAAALLHSVRFLFVGDGAEVDKLKQKVSGLKLENVVFLPPQPRSEMPRLLAACDLALVQLRSSDILGTAVPSKIFEAMAMGRPVVLAAPYGEAADIVLEAECGVHVAPGEPAALAAAIRLIRDSEEDRLHLGRNGYRAAMTFSREAQARQFLEILEDVRADRDVAQ